MRQSLAVERDFTFPAGDLGRESIELKRQTIIAIVVTVAVIAPSPTSQTWGIEPDEHPVGISP
jgi:hypothetical protein